MTRGRTLAGRYEVGEVIGRGGMAEVHRGRDLRSGLPVAVKLLRRDLAPDPLFQAMFRREAQTLAGLRHPSIVTVYDTGDDVVGTGSAQELHVPFLVLEYVAGQPLADLLRQGGLTPGEAIRHQLDILSALEVSHRAGVVHRDIKPANVMITPYGGVKIVDFGIARSSTDPATTVTAAPGVLGTPRYLSPEQVRGVTADARSDLYSAGCLLYELLTGRPPFEGDDPVSLAYQHVHEDPPLVSTHNPDLPPALDAVLVRALAKGREDRFQTARAFREALRSAARGLGHDDGAHAGLRGRCA